MKAHRGKNGIAPWVLDEAVAEAMRQIDIQSNEIAARCFNEMTIAMDQAGISKDDILKVHKTLDEAVVPKIKDIRENGFNKAQKDDNSQEIADSDTWMQMYCESRGLPYLEFE